MSATPAQDVYEICPREERDGFDLIGDRLQDGPIWMQEPMQSAARSRTQGTLLLSLAPGYHPRVL